jgi:hypothetical protein
MWNEDDGSAGQYTQNGYGHAMIGMYGGLFKEDIWAYVWEN